MLKDNPQLPRDLFKNQARTQISVDSSKNRVWPLESSFDWPSLMTKDATESSFKTNTMYFRTVIRETRRMPHSTTLTITHASESLSDGCSCTECKFHVYASQCEHDKCKCCMQWVSRMDNLSFWATYARLYWGERTDIFGSLCCEW